MVLAICLGFCRRDNLVQCFQFVCVHVLLTTRDWFVLILKLVVRVRFRDSLSLCLSLCLCVCVCVDVKVGGCVGVEVFRAAFQYLQ